MDHAYRPQSSRVSVLRLPADHAPPHVHVFKAGNEVKIALGDDEEPPRVLGRRGMGERDIIRVMRLVDEHQEALLKAWGKFHA